MGTVHRLRAVLGLQKRNYPHLLGRAKAVHNGLSGNPTMFVDPNPSLAVLLGKIVAFDQAQQAADTRARGTAATRDLRAREVITSLETARTYVQELVDANPEQGAALIEAASMTVGQVRPYTKPLLSAKQDHPNGAVHVTANVGVLTGGASGRVFFNWQSSGDGGQTWTPAGSTAYARNDFAGLTPMETHAFRVSVTDANGAGAWSQPVSLLVR
jgi:hypothetical protein